MLVQQVGLAEPVAVFFELVLEEARDREDESQRDDDRHVFVGAHKRADSLRAQRVADGDVPVDSEERREPRVGEAQEVDDRIQADEDVRVDFVVTTEDFEFRLDDDEAAHEQGAQQDEGVGDGEGLEHDGRREAMLLVTQYDERHDVGDDAQHGDRDGNDDLGDEPEVNQLRRFRVGHGGYVADAFARGRAGAVDRIV